MQHYFFEIADELIRQISSNEVLLLNLQAEESTFVRLNNNKVRQAGFVKQSNLSMTLILDHTHSRASCELTGNKNSDLSNILKLITQLRAQLKFLPADPYLHYATTINNSEKCSGNTSPAIDEVLPQILESAHGLDLVGIWASGTQSQGFANSLGQRNWFGSDNFNFDWSVYVGGDKAIKMNYAGALWDRDIYNTTINNCRDALRTLARTPITLSPGRYRVYLAPTALAEIVGMMCWGGFDLKSHRTAQTPLLKMISENKMLHKSISIKENQAIGVAPDFTAEGFIKPRQIDLIKNGRYIDCLADSRSAKEYQCDVNADSGYPSSIDICAGDELQEDILKTLHTGIYVNNLWYCNFSDRSACKITGMTRYACYWVEDGNIVAPINVMRFDETLYNMLGDNLLGLTKNRQFIADPSSYQHRSNSVIHLPGALISDFALTL